MATHAAGRAGDAKSRLFAAPECCTDDTITGVNLLLILMVLAIMVLMYVQRHGPPL